MDKRYRYTIPNTERKYHHLVVSEETHDVIKYYAQKWNVTITEATQRLLAKVIEEATKNEQYSDSH